MNSRERLIEAANRYNTATGRALSGVGLEVMNDTKFFDKILAGSGCHIDTYDKVMAWFAKNTPSEIITKKNTSTKKLTNN